MDTEFTARVTDFERAPWLPLEELAVETDWAARWCALDLDAGYDDLARRHAHEVRLMKDEDMRVGDAYRDAYRAHRDEAAT